MSFGYTTSTRREISPSARMSEPHLAPARAANWNWKWGVCGLLLMATMINYMDRLTLNQSSKRVMEEIKFQEGGYASAEAYFGAAFAIGALLWGWLVDRVNVRWVYPGTVLLVNGRCRYRVRAQLRSIALVPHRTRFF